MTDALADHLREHDHAAWWVWCVPARVRDPIVVTDMVRVERGQHLAVCSSCGRRGVYLRDGEPRCRYCGGRGLS